MKSIAAKDVPGLRELLLGDTGAVFNECEVNNYGQYLQLIMFWHSGKSASKTQ